MEISCEINVQMIGQIATGWSTCLKAMAGTASLMKKTNKLTLSQDLILTVNHDVVEALI